MVNTIGNPLSWTAKAVLNSGEKAVELTSHVASDQARKPPVVNKIGMEDIRYAVKKGFEDLGAFRTDVMILCLLYPVIGLLLVAVSFRADMAPFAFPLLSGFAILGPIAAVGLYEMSRRRVEGLDASWSDALSVLRAPSVGAMLVFGVYLLVIFAAWLAAAGIIHAQTMGGIEARSPVEFFRNVLTTQEGLAMVAIGIPVGGVFAAIALAIGIVTVPLLLDRDVGLAAAIGTSLALVRRNPVTVGLWGAMIAVSLALAAVPFLLGLVLVMPVLGHASWHFYRRAVS